MSWKTISRNRAWAPAAAALLLAGAPAWAQDIEVESLGPVDPFSVGVMTPSQGGLPDDLWQGSTAELAAEAMSRVPADSDSPAVNRLIAKALLSGGEPPEGADGDALAAQRMQALLAAGFAEDAARLASRTPDVAARPGLAEAQANAFLVSGDLDGACATADSLREGREGAFWLRLRAVCLAVAGQTTRADLTAELAREEGDNPQFERAYALAVLGEALEEEVETADPLVFASAIRAGARITLADAASRAMMAPPAEDEPHLAVLRAARAAKAGLITPAAVAAVYESVPRPALEPGVSRLDAALDSPDGAREALLYQLALDATEAPDQRAQALAASLESVDDAAGFLLAARLLTPGLRDLPTDAGRDDALLFAQAAAAAGDPSLARRWLRTATERPAPPAPNPGSDAGAPVPLGVAPPWTPPEPEDVASVEALIALSAEGPEAAQSRLESEGEARVRFIDAAVLAALGKTGDPAMRLALLRGEGGDGERADADVLLAMDSAAADGATAETALLAAAAMGPGPVALAPADLVRVVRALATVGLEQDAREAGLEAMLAARL